MHHTTLLVLLLLVFGQFCVLGSAALFLWLAGEFGDPPRWTVLLRKLRNSDAAVNSDAVARVAGATHEVLCRLPLSADLLRVALVPSQRTHECRCATGCHCGALPVRAHGVHAVRPDWSPHTNRKI